MKKHLMMKGRLPLILVTRNNFRRKALVVALALFGVAALVPTNVFAQDVGGASPFHGSGPDHDGVGNVYAMTNGVRHNAVVVFRRGANGRLEQVGKVPTGGRGSGGLLENQGALILSQGNRWLFAANPGSDEISVFEVCEGGRLRLVDVVRSGGDRPVSLTVSQDLLYVLNAGSSGNITAFRVGPHGHLTHLAHSTRELSTTASAPCPAVVADRGDPHAMCSIAGPTTIGFDPNGGVLVVTERITSEIDTWTIGDDGRATRAAIVSQPANSTPFGFDFAQRGRMVVADSFLDKPGLGAASSFILSPKGHLTSKTTALGSGNTSSCWTIITNDGHVAFVTNPASQAVSSYTIEADGSLSLRNPTAGSLTGGDPRDPALSEDGRFLYVLNNNTAVISGFRVKDDGSLKLLDFDAGRDFPSGANGLAAY